VEKVQVEAVGAQAAQGCLQRLPDVPGGGVLTGELPGLLIDGVAPLGDERDLVALARRVSPISRSAVPVP